MGAPSSVGLLLLVLGTAWAQESQCSWSSPDGAYQIEWEFDPATLLVTFGIDTKPERLTPGQDSWTGLMIGRSMASGDFLIVQALWNNRTGTWDLAFKDMRSGGGYSAPVPDDAGQDHIVNAEGRVVDGRIYARFSRPLQTTDSGDQSLAECSTYFGFPVSGGQIFREPGAAFGREPKLFLGRHFMQSPPQKKNICIPRDCSKAAPVTRPPPPPPTRPPPPPPTTPRAPVRARAQEMPDIQCSAGQNDHSSCLSYLEEYFQNVTAWAEQNAFEPATQFPRACGLLLQAQNGLIKAVCCRNLSEKFCRSDRSSTNGFPFKKK